MPHVLPPRVLGGAAAFAHAQIVAEPPAAHRIGRQPAQVPVPAFAPAKFGAAVCVAVQVNGFITGMIKTAPPAAVAGSARAGGNGGRRCREFMKCRRTRLAGVEFCRCGAMLAGKMWHDALGCFASVPENRLRRGSRGAGLGRLLQAVSDGQRRLRGMDIRSLTAEAAGGKRQMKKTARRRLS